MTYAKHQGNNVVYVVGQHAFVALPSYRGIYLKTHPCVTVPCGYCGSPAGHPCSGKSGYTSGTHRHRHDEYEKRTRKHGGAR